ncbi:MAG: chromate efflux transporter [Terrimicrobiaceae bacterium]
MPTGISRDATSIDGPVNPPSLRKFALFWLKIGCISFGGPAAHIGLMHREIVERLGWMDEKRFSHALGFCMLLPGPEAQQLATYIGWRMYGAAGGVISGALFVLPAAILLWLLSLLYVLGGNIPAVAGFFDGLQPVVVALIMMASIRMGRRSLRRAAPIIAALVSFGLLTIWHVPYPVVLLGSVAAGLLLPGRFGIEKSDIPTGIETGGRTYRAGWMALALWVIPLGLLCIFEQGLFAKLATFFSTTSLLTFGGAYAILPYVAQASVANGWLGAPEMLDGLGLAESTPGPLIIVLQFVGFLAAYHQPGELSPLVAATLGAIVATWMTFVPSFVWIFFGAPHVERMLRNFRLSSGLAAVSASVAGIVASLAVWFAMHVFFDSAAGIQWFSITIFLGSLAAHRLGVVPLILIGGLAGVLRQIVT